MTVSRNMGLRLRVGIDLLSSDQEDEQDRWINGYRPLCRVEQGDDDDVIIDLVELRLEREIVPVVQLKGRLNLRETSQTWPDRCYPLDLSSRSQRKNYWHSTGP